MRENFEVPDEFIDQLVDTDPSETAEWHASFDATLSHAGPVRARYLMLSLLKRAHEKNIGLSSLRTTDYINTIPPENEPDFPGDEAIERRIRAYIRWNAAMLVHRAQRPGVGVGGHISTYASSASLYEVGFNHFFRGQSHPGGGDQIFFQGHASPGMYARAFMEGRFSEDQLDGFRQELSHHGGGLSSYPHPRLMPDFWQFPTVSMGIGPINAIYQARFNRYLQNRGIKDTSQQHVWAFLGDGEVDEVDTLGAIGLANIMNKTLDGDFQTFKAESGAYVREHFFGRDPRTAAMVSNWSDDQIWNLKRGGHDYRKLFAAYTAAMQQNGRPTVILAKTIKGWTLGSHFEGRNSTHQMKKMTMEDIVEFRDRLGIPIPDEKLDKYLPPYFKPAPDSDEAKYLEERRNALGGSIPSRRKISRPLAQPDDSFYESMKRGSGNQEIATTMAFVRMLKDLIKAPDLGARLVPIIPDEARTFGMDSLFPTLKIYSPSGQQYASVDRDLMLSYKESTTGVILHEGINEAGSVASFTAVGSSYSTHDEPMIPIYIFYSMFGFQRTGDAFWAASDQLTRGFVLGATAGRTTLNGEGLQHEDGHSHLLASTNPAVVAYDPAFAYELGHIVKDGLRRMYGENSENIYYYITLYNEPYVHPAQPENLDVEGLLKGIYLYQVGQNQKKLRAQILASGVGLNWAIKAQQLLQDDWGVAASIWSVTSWNELRRDGLEVDSHNLLHPKDQRQAYISKKLADTRGPVIAVSDFMRAVQDQVAPWVSNPFASLGTDGFGLSDTRGALRRHFKVDAQSIAIATLQQLAKLGEIKVSVVEKAIQKYQIFDITSADPGNTEGSG